jgi:hypothetical protein
MLNKATITIDAIALIGLGDFLSLCNFISKSIKDFNHIKFPLKCQSTFYKGGVIGGELGIGDLKRRRLPPRN